MNVAVSKKNLTVSPIEDVQGRADTRRPEQCRDRQQASAVDDGDALPGCDAMGGQACRAVPYYRRQLAVTDGAPADDERSPAGIGGGGGVMDRPGVHAA